MFLLSECASFRLYTQQSMKKTEKNTNSSTYLTYSSTCDVGMSAWPVYFSTDEGRDSNFRTIPRDSFSKSCLAFCLSVIYQQFALQLDSICVFRLHTVMVHSGCARSVSALFAGTTSILHLPVRTLISYLRFFR